jgi:hypothetical protein
VSAVAVASFATFGAVGKSDIDDLRATCAGHCKQSDVDSAWSKLIVADVSLGVGVVAAGLATWLFLAPRKRDASARASIAPIPHGATIGVTASF